MNKQTQGHVPEHNLNTQPPYAQVIHARWQWYVQQKNQTFDQHSLDNDQL